MSSWRTRDEKVRGLIRALECENDRLEYRSILIISSTIPNRFHFSGVKLSSLKLKEIFRRVYWIYKGVLKDTRERDTGFCEIICFENI